MPPQRHHPQGDRRVSEVRGPKVEIIIPIPGYGAEQPAYIDFPGKFTELQWAYVMNVLTVMKPGLVMAESADAGQRPEESDA
jgi:hypothetical protein